MTSHPTVTVRFLEPRDVPSLCALLTTSFREEYERQGLDVWGFERQYRLIAWANKILTPLGMDFFQVVVALMPDGDGGEKVVGTMASFPAADGLWYQGFGAVDPSVRRQGLYKRVIRRSLEGIARRGAEQGGGEIRIDNLGALYPYRDVFGCEVVPVRRLYLVPCAPGAVAAPESPTPLTAVGDDDLDRWPWAEDFRRRFRGGFLVEREIRRGLVGSVLRWLLPPVTTRGFAWFRGDGAADRIPPAALARVRCHWPARILAVDAVRFTPDLTDAEARDFLRALLREIAPGTKAPLRIYAAEDDVRLRRVAEAEGFETWTDVYPIRTDVAAALARTDAQGRPLTPLSPLPETAPDV